MTVLRADEESLSPKLTVREARTDDLPKMREVVLAAYQQYARDLPDDLFGVYLDDLLDYERHAGHGTLLVVEAGGQVLACGAFYADVADQHMGWPSGWAGGRGLAVHPDARGQGAARALLAEAEARARRVGAKAFAFHTATFMTDAIALYARLGYRRAPAYDLDLGVHFGILNAAGFPTIAYVRELEEKRPGPSRRSAISPSHYLGRSASVWRDALHPRG
jgi:GNAT superfamily N-acetyltransferase